MEAILIVSIFILCFSNETFEVLASSTDNKPEGFNKVYDGKPVDVYSVDGKLVRGQAKSLNGLKGVYVINGKAVIVK